MDGCLDGLEEGCVEGADVGMVASWMVWRVTWRAKTTVG